MLHRKGKRELLYFIHELVKGWLSCSLQFFSYFYKLVTGFGIVPRKLPCGKHHIYDIIIIDQESSKSKTSGMPHLKITTLNSSMITIYVTNLSHVFSPFVLVLYLSLSKLVQLELRPAGF